MMCKGYEFDFPCKFGFTSLAFRIPGLSAVQRKEKRDTDNKRVYIGDKVG